MRICASSTIWREGLSAVVAPGGVNASSCDGSVRFFSNDINLATWRALSTSRGGETFDPSELRADRASGRLQSWRQHLFSAKIRSKIVSKQLEAA